MTHQPPIARQQPQELTRHGHTRQDPYFWLRERENPEVLAYIEAENRYTEAMMSHTADCQETLYREMVGRIQETDQSVPTRRGEYFYYTRTEAGRQYDIYCRRRGSMDAPEEILLDPNQISAAEELDFLEVGIFAPSPDHRWLAYSLDTSGGERFTIRFKNLETGEIAPEAIPDTLTSGEWAADSRTFFYTTVDEAWRSSKLWRHAVGRPAGEDRLVYEETDALFELTLYKTKDEAYLVLWCRGLETTECRVLPAAQPQGAWVTIEPRRRGHRYKVQHRGGRLIILTNHEASNYRVVTAPAATPGLAHWEAWIPHSEEVTILDYEVFAGHAVLYEQHQGLHRLRIIDLASNKDHFVSFDESVFALEVNDYEDTSDRNPDFHSHVLRFIYGSLATPSQTYDYNMVSRERVLLKEEPVLGGFDRENYVTERLWATAADGERVPVSLVRRRETAPGPDTPCLLYGYGSYGASFDPLFRPRYVSLLDRGFIVGIAHIRGGREMGQRWYEQGKFLNKKNTFTDFVACARHLVAEGYTSPGRFAIYGRSAGGLLMGAVINLAPELFRAAVAGVPFVDVVSTMLDDSIPLTVGEWEEWGNPRDETFYHYMVSYSPYDNLVAGEYPAILATSGLNDPRVQYWEPTKWVARLRTLKRDGRPLLLKTNLGAGHSGASGRYDYLREVAFEYAFILDQLGVPGG